MLTDDHGNASLEMACGLAGEIVRTFGEVRLRVFGTSMVPSIHPGDLLTIQRAGLTEISPGEVVLFLQKGRLFVHRVVDRRAAGTGADFGESCLITRGDRLRHDDPPVTSPELLGRVIGIERGNRKVEIPSHRSNNLIVRLLQTSDRATYLYLRLAARWRTLFITGFLRGGNCRV
jgi:signal peptidase I